MASVLVADGDDIEQINNTGCNTSRHQMNTKMILQHPSEYSTPSPHTHDPCSEIMDGSSSPSIMNLISFVSDGPEN